MHVTEEHSSDDDLPAAQPLFQKASTKKKLCNKKPHSKTDRVGTSKQSVPRSSSDHKRFYDRSLRNQSWRRRERGGGGDDVTPGWMSLAAEEEWRRTPKQEVSSGWVGLKDPR